MWAARNTGKSDRLGRLLQYPRKGLNRRCQTGEAEHPDAVLLAHPECRIEVLEIADHVTSTSGMLRYAQASDAKEFIVGTEMGLMHRLRMENPGKKFWPSERHDLSEHEKDNAQKRTQGLSGKYLCRQSPEEIRVPAKRA